jgi:uncharacterized protein (DUF4415 family)
MSSLPNKFVKARKMAQRLLNQMTPEEDAAITIAAESDFDNPPLKRGFISGMRPTAKAAPQFLIHVRKTRGPQKAPRKISVTLRLSPDVLDHFKSGGAGWQTRVDETLLCAVRKQSAVQKKAVAKKASVKKTEKTANKKRNLKA